MSDHNRLLRAKVVRQNPRLCQLQNPVLQRSRWQGSVVTARRATHTQGPTLPLFSSMGTHTSLTTASGLELEGWSGSKLTLCRGASGTQTKLKLVNCAQFVHLINCFSQSASKGFTKLHQALHKKAPACSKHFCALLQHCTSIEQPWRQVGAY